jgi:hypothetical protein
VALGSCKLQRQIYIPALPWVVEKLQSLSCVLSCIFFACSDMAYLLYKHIKAKRAAAAADSGNGNGNGKGGNSEIPNEKKAAKPVKLCEHQREINLDTLNGMPSDMSDFATSPQLKESDPQNRAVDGAGRPGDIGPCVICKEEKRAARIYRWKLIAGLFFPFSVQALDTTIVAGALPFIASDFRES